MPYFQKSYIRQFGNKQNFMETNIVEDLQYLINESNSGNGNQQVLGASIWANGFRVVGCIGDDITLPNNANFEFTGPLSMCAGSTLTIPVGTTLTIV
jgi:hypothetical protein